ncbi:MAG: hypothetical protein HOL01_02010 [Planctomycetaceae bacterium]|jgi:hypothetical protein|nr:hypothetical protein [Planctomycetaceae bacterium]MBT6484605.1 hypothetical protein [Planctomycetaceae bacterium]MBT6493303.1 hypothetical protein [Planctomycetaceae bacterium]
MRSLLLAMAAGTIVSAAGMDNTAVADGGYYYAPPVVYVAPPVHVVRPVYYPPPAPIIVHRPVYYPPPVVYYPPPVAYYPPPAFRTSVRYKRNEIKVREYTPWGVRKYELEYKGHGIWELDD